MPFAINTLSAQARQLTVEQIQGNRALRMREDGDGIATTRWERFKVGFFDLFRTRNTIDQMKIQASDHFVQALRENRYSNPIEYIGRPLTARAFTETMNDFARAQHLMQEAKKLRDIEKANLRYQSTLTMLSDPNANYGAINFTENLKTALRELAATAQQIGISDADFNRFKNEWIRDGRCVTSNENLVILGRNIRTDLECIYKEKKDEIASIEANKFCLDQTKQHITEQLHSFKDELDRMRALSGEFDRMVNAHGQGAVDAALNRLGRVREDLNGPEDLERLGKELQNLTDVRGNKVLATQAESSWAIGTLRLMTREQVDGMLDHLDQVAGLLRKHAPEVLAKSPKFHLIAGPAGNRIWQQLAGAVPDGHFKFPHLWPPKFLQGRTC